MKNKMASGIDKLKKLSLLLLKNPHILFNNKEYIFILSHIRSRSTLLSHILGSNPSISGYSESHNSYSNWKDFARMRIRIYHANTNKSNPKFFLDKLLWNHNYVSKKMC